MHRCTNNWFDVRESLTRRRTAGGGGGGGGSIARRTVKSVTFQVTAAQFREISCRNLNNDFEPGPDIGPDRGVCADPEQLEQVKHGVKRAAGAEHDLQANLQQIVQQQAHMYRNGQQEIMQALAELQNYRAAAHGVGPGACASGGDGGSAAAAAAGGGGDVAGPAATPPDAGSGNHAGARSAR